MWDYWISKRSVKKKERVANYREFLAALPSYSVCLDKSWLMPDDHWSSNNTLDARGKVQRTNFLDASGRTTGLTNGLAVTNR